MAGIFDDITPARSNLLQRLDAGEQIDPAERDQLTAIATQRQGEFRKGLRRFAYNAEGATKAFFGQMAEPFAPQFGENLINKGLRTIQSQPAEVAPKYATFDEARAAGDYLPYATGVLGEGLPSVATVLAGGLAGRGLATLGRASAATRNAAQYAGGAGAALPMEGGETSLSLRMNPEAMANTTPAERAALSLGRGAISAGLESAVPNLLLTNTIGGAARRVASGYSAGLSNVARKAAAGGVGEFGTEAAQEFTGQVAENIAAPTTGYDMDRIREAGIRGAIVGGGIGTAAGGVQSVVSNLQTGAESAAAGTNDLLNKAVERIDYAIQNPEQMGFDAANATLGTLSDLVDKAAAATEGTGTRAADAIDSLGELRKNLDAKIAQQLTPENKARYAALSSNLHLLQAGEYDLLKAALRAETSEETNIALGALMRRLTDRVPKDTLEGASRFGEWLSKLGKGAKSAVTERRAKESRDFSSLEKKVFKDMLKRYPSVAQALGLITPDNAQQRQVLRNFMGLLEDPGRVTARNTPEGAKIRDDFFKATGFEIGDVLRDLRDYNMRGMTAAEEGAVATNVGGNTGAIAENMRQYLTDDVFEMFESQMQRGGSIDIQEEGDGMVSYFDEQSGQRITKRAEEVVGESATPFNNIDLVRRTLTDNARFTNKEINAPIQDGVVDIPAKFSSDELTATQIAQLIGYPDRGQQQQYTQGQLASRIDKDDKVFTNVINTVALTANTGKGKEQGGYREDFLPFVEGAQENTGSPENMATRLISTVAQLADRGIVLDRDQFDPAELEALGIDPQGLKVEDGNKLKKNPIVIKVEPDFSKVESWVTKGGAARTSRQVGMDMGGFRKYEEGDDPRLPAQSQKIEELLNDEEFLKNINKNLSLATRQPGGTPVGTMKAISRGYYGFTREKVGPNKAAINKALNDPANLREYAGQLLDRMSNTAVRRATTNALTSLRRAAIEDFMPLDDFNRVLRANGIAPLGATQETLSRSQKAALSEIDKRDEEAGRDTIVTSGVWADDADVQADANATLVALGVDDSDFITDRAAFREMLVEAKEQLGPIYEDKSVERADQEAAEGVGSSTPEEDLKAAKQSPEGVETTLRKFQKQTEVQKELEDDLKAGVWDEEKAKFIDEQEKQRQKKQREADEAAEEAEREKIRKDDEFIRKRNENLAKRREQKKKRDVANKVKKENDRLTQELLDGINDGSLVSGNRTRVAQAVKGWSKKYLNGREIKVVEMDFRNSSMFRSYWSRAKNLNFDPFEAYGIAQYNDDPNTSGIEGSVIWLNTRRPEGIAGLQTLAHEFGHLIQHHSYQNAEQGVKDRLEAAYLREVTPAMQLLQDAKASNRQTDFTEDEWKTLGKAFRVVRNTPFEGKDKAKADKWLKEFAESTEGLDTEGSMQALSERLLAQTLNADPDRSWTLDYALSFDEFFAEQFARYAVGDPNVFAQESKTVRNWLDKVVAKIKEYYETVFKPYHQTLPEFKDYVESLAQQTPAPINKDSPTEQLDLEQLGMDEVPTPPDDDYADVEDRNLEDDAPPPDAEPPQEPPSEPPTPGDDRPPPPPPDPEAQKRFTEIVKRLVGDRVKIEFGDVDLLNRGVAAQWEDAIHGGSLENTANSLQRVREARREVINERNERDNAPREEVTYLTDAQYQKKLDDLQKVEQEYLQDLAVRGTIRVAAGMESQAGLAEHESFHAAFAFFFDQYNNADRKVLGTAFSRGVLSRRLRTYFKNQPEILEVIDPTSQRFSAEEAAAYAFQVYVHDPGALQLGQKVEGIFNRFLQFLQRLVGYKTYEERAKIIFDDLNSGRRAERGVSPLQRNLNMEKSMREQAQSFLRGVGRGAMTVYDSLLGSTFNRLEESGNPALAQIARLGYNETGAEGDGMIQNMRRNMTRYSNEMKGVFDGLDGEDMATLNEAMVLGKELKGKLGKRQAELRKLLADLLKYQQQAGIAVAEKGNYFPLVWSPEKVEENSEQFREMLEKYRDQFLLNKQTPEELYEAITSYLDRGQNFSQIMSESGEPASASSQRRTYDFISKEDRLPFMGEDPVETVAHYIQQAVRHAEFVRAYGHHGSKLNGLRREASETYGASVDDMQLAQDYVDGLMGNKEVGMSRELKDLYGAATVYQNVRLLPLSVFSSLVDPLGIAVRTNDIGGAFETFTYSLKNLFTDWRKEYTPDQWATISADMGVIDMSGTVKAVDKVFTGMTLRGKTRDVNDFFFKANLLNGWVKNNHIMATKMATKFIQRSGEGFFGEERSAENLAELGLNNDDVIFDESLGRIKLYAADYLPQGTTLETAEESDRAFALEQQEKMRRAIHKVVRQSLIQPSTAELPNWMSNPYLAPIAHLKTFVFGFNRTILDRLMYEAQRGNYSPLLYASVYVPGMIAADFIKGFVGNGGDEPEWKKNWGVGDYLKHGVYRSGLTGTGQFFADIGNDVNRGGGGWESLAGPSLEQGKDFVAAMAAPTSRPMQSWMVDAMPANTLYDQWIME